MTAHPLRYSKVTARWHRFPDLPASNMQAMSQQKKYASAAHDFSLLVAIKRFKLGSTLPNKGSLNWVPEGGVIRYVDEHA